jgi:Protein of unknown function (DUF998)
MNEVAHKKQVRLMQIGGVVAMGGFLAYIAITLGFLILRPDLNPLRRVMSNYAVGPRGYLMEIAFIAFGSGLLALSATIAGSRVDGRRARVGSGLVGVAGIGLFVAAIFPTDVNPDDMAVTVTGTVHVAAGVVTFLCLTVGCVALAGVAWTQPPATMVASVVAVVAFLIVVAGAAVGLRGLGQRIFLYTILAWLTLASYQLSWGELAKLVARGR